jgi:hypothetical protein
MKKTGVFIIVVGIGLTFLTCFTSFSKVKPLAVKQSEFVRNKPQSLNWYPLFSVAIFVVGAAVLGRSSEI